ncbi:uncharacterized protein MELLADRAFT_101177 [Melampsora larici-populina 98AG31]|uniref:Uncharacterized protein n=1 Tax=Melampsora larici-populina (strain 98AG31 / pathotype 3-4-7) TaxID=747676 RepID=F4R3V4_MELLP|nr:uncharacterized protein MELLADRAFT_101177 [Melampsora larici-populina 98AG31]EGG13097.1 hypothetical protein MELLADRAFT_101177 [Melampsora larici-populina 98AG31]
MSERMNLSCFGNLFRCALSATVCLTICMLWIARINWVYALSDIGAIPSFTRLTKIPRLDPSLSASIPSLTSAVKVESVEKVEPVEQVKPVEAFRDERILKLDRYQDPTSQKLLLHLMTSSKYQELGFAKKFKVIETVERKNKFALVEDKIAEVLEQNGLDVPKDTIRLQLWGKYANIAWDKLSGDQLEDYVKTIITKMNADTKGAKEISKRYAEAISRGNYGVIIDNEADDLLYLLLQFEDGIVPKFLISYGGFTELRYQSLVEFIEEACREYKIEPERIPKVYKGFPHPYKEGDERHPYDYEEGSGVIEEAKRVQYIEESQALEKSLKDDSGKEWKTDAWSDPTFKEGLDALRDLIDKEDYTAIAVLTSPAALHHVIDEDPRRARKVGVTMASPWTYDMNEKGVLYTRTYNSARQIDIMNKLLKSDVDFIGVGGGTARTEGMRTIHDYQHGNKGAKLYLDPGLKHLDTVISTESPFRLLRIIAHAGNNVSAGKWRDWDGYFSELWKYLEIKEPERPNLERLRKKPQGVIDLLEKEAEAKKAKLEEELKKKKEEMGKDDMLVDEDPKKLPSEVDLEKKKEEDKPPKVAGWNLDRLITLMKIWYLWGGEVLWQAPSADLHALITTEPSYVEGILGAVRYESKDWPAEFDKEGNPVPPKPILDQMINSDSSNLYSISNMRYNLVIDKLQGVLNKFNEASKASEHPALDSHK